MSFLGQAIYCAISDKIYEYYCIDSNYFVSDGVCVKKVNPFAIYIGVTNKTIIFLD